MEKEDTIQVKPFVFCRDVQRPHVLLNASSQNNECLTTSNWVNEQQMDVLYLWYSVKGAQLMPSGKQKRVIAFSVFSSSSL